MARNSKIEWTDDTWNVVTGCKIVSPGCTDCYAMRLAGTRLRNHPSRKGLTTLTKAGPVWNGKFHFNRGWLLDPLRWKDPRNIFVCAHGDLFYEEVPDEVIDQVFAVMSLALQHTLQVLTKRAERMRAYCSDPQTPRRIAALIFKWGKEKDGNLKYETIKKPGDGLTLRTWPLPNVWFGVSAERQREADERIPHLLATPAAVRFLSAEPLLGPIDLSHHFGITPNHGDLRGLLNWVIVGGESGPNARPMHPQWARDLRDQCQAAGVPFFFKQWGGVNKKKAGRELDGQYHNEMPD
jgi:protein gp37